ncbi:hypothetical protein [Amycolatopsis suaedae]|uniref:Uncharacterized protein n=1 Tax=Amycolatopsis suaedae TaxID=2510978 RepID=A0A4Q7J8Y1_9PSEU|nr:hypothetical protein [Amycolatopsis suaedae]RZQ62584.1 hypothetical protein EWH70_16550 [Amycolatopsis suaedae]
MRCEDSHAWWRLVDGPGEPPAGEMLCPEDGGEAVVAMRHPLADRVTVTLVPAAWEREGTIGFRDEYFVEISSHRHAETLRSARTYSWETAQERLAWFKDIDWEAAKRRWTRGDFTKPA